MDPVTDRSTRALQSHIARRVLARNPRNTLTSKVEKRGKGYDASVRTAGKKVISIAKSFYNL